MPGESRLTLVVETNGYNDKTWLTREGLPHTDRLRATERYTRLDYGHMALEITYEDPGTFTRPVQLNPRPGSSTTAEKSASPSSG
jgi:hypothetical protein